MLNFESDHRNEKEETERSFISRTKTCFRCNKTGHIAAHCRSKLVNKVNQSSSDRPPVKCFRWLEIEHIARDCMKEFERKSAREDQLLAETNETHFSYNSAERVDGNLVIDSGATCSMIKDKNLFIELDQSFSETVENANKTESKVLGKGRVEFFVKDCQGNSKKISMNDYFYVPENSENLVSVSKLTRGGVKVVFGEKSCTEQGNGTVYPLSERVNLFIWKMIGFGNHKKLSAEKMQNNSSEFRISKTYFCRETEEKNFNEQKENLIKDNDIKKEVELKNEPRAHPKSKTSLNERGKEESRKLCEVQKFQSIDMKLGSKLWERKKFESRAGKLIRIFDIGQKKSNSVNRFLCRSKLSF